MKTIKIRNIEVNVDSIKAMGKKEFKSRYKGKFGDLDEIWYEVTGNKRPVKSEDEK